MMYNFFMKMKAPKEIERIGQRLARIRKEAGLTQQEMADSLGISRSSLAEYERGRFHLNDSLLIKISQTMGISSDSLLGLKESKNYEGQISLRFLKRLIEIEKLPETRKKIVLRNLDDAIIASKK
jgi:transcriptional regulator with XRE-family HTH domain